MSYYAFEGLIPVVHPDAFVHPSAVLIGDVIVGAGVYIGPLASLRGDYGRLILEAGSNLQDGCIMHGYCDTDTIVHENGHIGHGAILHGCVVGRDALVGMNSVIMDGAVIGEESIVAAMSFVKAGFQGEAGVTCARTTPGYGPGAALETPQYQRISGSCDPLSNGVI